MFPRDAAETYGLQEKILAKFHYSKKGQKCQLMLSQEK